MIKLQKGNKYTLMKFIENLKSRFEDALKSYLTGSLFINPHFRISKFASWTQRQYRQIQKPILTPRLSNQQDYLFITFTLRRQ
jgi:hypothetical protein